MNKVLITGGFGYVGTAVLPLLQHDYVTTTVVDNLMSGTRPDVYSDAIITDIRDRDHMQYLIPRYDVIIHLAAIVGEPAVRIDPQLAYDVNVVGTQNVIEAMRKNQRLVFTSSTSVYGNKPGETVTEETIPEPTNDYARHKYIGEKIAATIPDHIILRPATAFGITRRTRLDVLVNTLIYEALSTGKIQLFEPDLIRPILYVQDFAKIIAYASYGLFPAGIYNIGDPNLTMTKGELAHHIAKLCNVSVIASDKVSLDLRDYDTCFDKITSKGFVFTEDSIERTIQEIQAQLPKIQENPRIYSAPYRVQEYIKK